MNPGVSVCTQVVGSQELFDYVKDNLEIRLDCCNHVLTPAVIAQNNKMTAINNAVQVDLLGQANAEFLKGVPAFRHGRNRRFCNRGRELSGR